MYTWLEREHERPEVWAILNEIDRRDSPQRKIDRAAAALRMSLECMRAGIRMQYPDWTEEQVKRELIRRRLPPDLFRRVYGGGP